jgi:hypothetical protein
MPVVLRIIGVVWILLTAKDLLRLIRGLFSYGLHVNIGVTDVLSLILCAGGIGLLWLYKWAWWALLVGLIGFLVVLTGPALLQFQLGPTVLRHLVFYGVFIALLLIPQAQSAVH